MFYGVKCNSLHFRHLLLQYPLFTMWCGFCRAPFEEVLCLLWLTFCSWPFWLFVPWRRSSLLKSLECSWGCFLFMNSFFCLIFHLCYLCSIRNGLKWTYSPRAWDNFEEKFHSEISWVSMFQFVILYILCCLTSKAENYSLCIHLLVYHFSWWSILIDSDQKPSVGIVSFQLKFRMSSIVTVTTFSLLSCY